jgi:NAD(P)H dehydrogenase (quinone)
MITVTGATGQLGRQVIAALLKELPPSEIVAAVRDTEKGKDLEDLGVQVRRADYDQPGSLKEAFKGTGKLLLVSSSEIGRRIRQHAAVIDAARSVNVELLAYTSGLHAETSPLVLFAEHRKTEAMLRQSGLSFVLLRNGWYTENHTAAIPAALEHGTLLGCAGAGRIASAARADYAAAAAKALLLEGQAGRVYELAGDSAYTMEDFAGEITKQTGKTVAYKDMPEEEYKAVLVSAGIPEGLAALLADSDTGASKGGLFDDSRQLSKLIGRPTTPLAESVAEAIKGS